MEKPRFKWCRETIEQVRFRPDRGKVRDELLAHIEDRMEFMISRGYTEEEAETRAVAAMGNAEKVGKQLNSVHKPWLGWLWIVSRVLVLALLFIAITFIPNVITDYKTELNAESKSWESRFDEDGVFNGSECINLYDLNLSGEVGGYRFTVDKAAWWGQTDDGIQLYILMDVTRPPFAPELTRKALEQFFIVDSQGLHMGVEEWHPEEFDPVIGLYGAGVQFDAAKAKTPLQGYCILRFNALRWEPEWVELSYEHNGQTVRFRIPGPEGGAP